MARTFPPVYRREDAVSILKDGATRCGGAARAHRGRGHGSVTQAAQPFLTGHSVIGV